MSKYGKNRGFYSINYTTFYFTASESVNKIRELNKFFEKDDISLEDEYIVKSIVYNTQRLAITTIIFSAMTLESYINYYGSQKLPKNYFEKHLDNLDLKSKWIVLPRLITGQEIDLGGKAFALFSELISLRNKLVHDKYKIIKESLPEEKDSLWETDAYSSIECVKLMINELKKIDNSVFTEWIE
ncbi:MAG TPA: hypothetical protein PKN48_08100 [Bacteroidales bacterium]|nr:hypothetical protein [Bacteroidales bacterium]